MQPSINNSQLIHSLEREMKKAQVKVYKERQRVVGRVGDISKTKSFSPSFFIYFHFHSHSCLSFTLPSAFDGHFYFIFV